MPRRCVLPNGFAAFGRHSRVERRRAEPAYAQPCLPEARDALRASAVSGAGARSCASQSGFGQACRLNGRRRARPARGQLRSKRKRACSPARSPGEHVRGAWPGASVAACSARFCEGHSDISRGAATCSRAPRAVGMCAMRAQRRRRVSTPRRPLAGRLIHRLSRSRRISRPPKRVVCAYYPPSYATDPRHKPRPADKPSPLAPGHPPIPAATSLACASFLLPNSPTSKRAGRKAPLPDRISDH